ncbi:MAG: TetR family transcriptional regulator, partial [Nonomuraea sp.]|nr:TetR family transcriptional regulator [Nonomuraea sp.]
MLIGLLRPESDVACLADALLAPLAAPLLAHRNQECGAERVKAALDVLVDGL